MAPTPTDAASAHVLDAAERMFLAHGYAGARLRDLAADLGIQPASLYHHAPGGKRHLWERVVGRALARHREGLRAAAAGAGPDLRGQLVAMAVWLLSQPALNAVTLAASDPAEPGALSERLYDALMVPVGDALRDAQARGEARGDVSPDLFAGVFVSAVAGLGPADRAGSLPRPATDLARDIVALLLTGVEPRQTTFC